MTLDQEIERSNPSSPANTTPSGTARARIAPPMGALTRDPAAINLVVASSSVGARGLIAGWPAHASGVRLNRVS